MPDFSQGAFPSLTQPYTMYQGVPTPSQNMMSFGGIPGMQGPMGQMMGMALYPALMGMAGQMGYAGLQFGGGQNFYDRQMGIDYYTQSRLAIARASKQDEQNYERKLLGVARLTGTAETEEVKRAAAAMAGDMAAMGTYIGDIMPDTFDAMHGIRGSAGMMARKVHSAGRYMMDPATGQIGMRGREAGILSDQLYQNMFGPRADVSEMKGFGAGRAGEMFDEMQRRGFLGGSSEMSAGDSKEMISRSEADRISKRLKNLVGAVAAMRDIFGDMGKQDAPMAELINGLQTLTQGGLATMDPTRLESTVRRIQATSKTSGVGMREMMQVMSRGAGLADQYGLNRQFGVDASLSAFAYGSAFGSIGGGAQTGWNMPSKDEVVAMDQSLRLSGANSDTANQMNATLAIYDQILGGKKANTQFSALAEAIKAGQLTYEFGGARHGVATSFENWRKIASDAGVEDRTAFAMRSFTYANQEYGDRYQTGDLSRRLQFGTDIAPILRESGKYGFAGMNLDDNRIGRLSERSIQALIGKDAEGKAYRTDAQGNLLSPLDPNYATGTPIGMSHEARASSQGRLDALVKVLMASPDAKGLNESQVRNAASIMLGDFENRLPGYTNLKGFNAMFAMFDPETGILGGQFSQANKDKGALASALSGLGRGGFVRNFMDALEGSDDQTSIAKFTAKIFGGVERPELAASLTAIRDKYREYQKSGPGVAKQTLLTQLQTLARQTGVQMEEIDLESESFSTRTVAQTKKGLRSLGIDPAKYKGILDAAEGIGNLIETIPGLIGESNVPVPRVDGRTGPAQNIDIAFSRPIQVSGTLTVQENGTMLIDTQTIDHRLPVETTRRV